MHNKEKVYTRGTTSNSVNPQTILNKKKVKENVFEGL